MGKWKNNYHICHGLPHLGTVFSRFATVFHGLPRLNMARFVMVCHVCCKSSNTISFVLYYVSFQETQCEMKHNEAFRFLFISTLFPHKRTAFHLIRCLQSKFNTKVLAEVCLYHSSLFLDDRYRSCLSVKFSRGTFGLANAIGKPHVEKICFESRSIQTYGTARA